MRPGDTIETRQPLDRHHTPTSAKHNAWDTKDRKTPVAHSQMVTVMHSASARDDIEAIGTEAGPADVCFDGSCFGGVVSRVPYPTLDQVAQSVAIQRLQWLRHLPAPRTTAENRVFQRIRALGWSAPG